MWLVEEADRPLLEQRYEEQPCHETSNVSKPRDASATLAQAKGPLKKLNYKVKSQNQRSRDVHHPPKEAQRNQNQNLCPRIQQDLGT